MPLEADYSATATVRGLPDGTRLLSALCADGRSVAIKVLAPEQATPADAERLRNEYEVGCHIACPAVLHPLAFGTWSGCPAMVLEDFDGQPLDALLGVPMPIERFLPLAQSIARALADVHAAGVVHRDIKPQNILVATAGGEVKLAGLGIASLRGAGHGSVKRATLIEGTLAFMSPEQTGRMNRPVDHRSDLYSLGVTLYQMLAGQLPFEAKEPIEWIHCHIARLPPPLTSVAPDVPPAISSIVMKLLSKVADDRYQAARGLARDLERCRQRLVSVGHVEPFDLGSDDVPEQFQIPQRLYGREQEAQALVSAFAGVVENGAPALLLVAGEAGTGKSRLVQEMEEPIVAARGFFVSGKFDQWKPDIPYSTFVQAFRQVVLEILAESEEGIALWRKRLEEALGMTAQLIVDVIPPIELVIGKQPPVPELPPSEAQNRFRTAFRQLIGVFAREEHPLTLFLDDLQWADSASLALLQDVMTRPEIRHLFIVGAYRDNEVVPSHALMLTVDEVRKAGTHVSSLVLGPLSNVHLDAFVSDALHCSATEAAPLACLVRAKTAGNPFFAVQFLTALHDERLIDFDRKAGGWRWDVAKISAKSFTDNVVDLMVGRLTRLAASTCEALEHLACVGNSAPIATLAMVHGRSEQETHADLREAVLGGLVLLAGDTYRFVHDRVQEATYSLIPETSRTAAHLRVGRILVADVTDDAGEDRLFDTVNQLNRGATLITDPDERESLCRLNFRAGRKAKAAIAYASARGYLTRATELSAPDAWSTRFEDTFALYLERAQCEYLDGQFERADELFSLLLGKAQSNTNRANASILRMQLYQLTGRVGDALTVMIKAAGSMGVSFPETDEALTAALETEQREISANLRGRRIADLVDAPMATDPDVRALISLLVAGTPCASIGQPKLAPLLVVSALNLSLRHGFTEGTSVACSAYGAVLISAFGDIPSAFEFSELALRLTERFADAGLKARIVYVHTHFVHCWRRPFATVLPLIEEVLPACLAVGELVFASYHGFLSIWLNVESGRTLDETLRVSRKYAAFAAGANNQMLSAAIRLEQQFVASLAAPTREPGNVDDDTFHEDAFLTAARDASFGTVTGFLHISKQIACFIYGRYDEALERATLAAPFLDAMMAMPIEATYHFILALTLTALHPHAPPEQKRDFEQRLQKELKQLAHWADNCPQNYANRHALVAAEIARIEGRDSDAMRLYEEAISSARDNGLVQNEALAFELASAFYRARGFERFAGSYLREARASYARWGAGGKVTQLDQRYPPEPFPVAGGRTSPSTTFTARTEQLDLFSIVAALQTISSVIVLDELVRMLLTIVLEQGGAERAALLLVDATAQLSVEAEAQATEAGVVISRQSGAPPSQRGLPESIIGYVWRTSEHVLLDDASGRSRFSNDEYVQGKKPRSVLCLPIVRQAKTVGLLYLENNLLTKAFTPDRLSVLELLASQAAISLENALLYADLERENEERRAAERAMRESEGVLHAIADNAPVIVIVKDLEGRYLLANRQYERVAGIPAGTLQGKTDFDVSPREVAEAVRASDREALECGVPITFERVDLQEDGPQTYIVTKFPLRDGGGVPYAVGAVATNITDRVRATEALLQSEERFRLLVDGVKDCAIFMLDREGAVASWNAGAQRLFGYSPDDILGQSGASFYPAEEAARGGPEHALAKATAHGSFEEDGWLLRKDGSRMFAGVVLTALRDERGELRSYSALVRDLTQRLKLDEQVREAQKMEAIGRLAGGVAHDFNNLIGAIYGFVYLGLKRLEPGSPVKADLEQILEAARMAGDLTKQLLAFARKQRVEPRVFDLNDLVLGMDRLLRRVLGDDIELVTQPSPDLDLVEVDPGQIEQVVLNLAVNARDAMPDGGTLTVETSSVILEDDYAGGHAGVTPGAFVMLALSDTGTGMTPAVLEHIFEPFFTTKAVGEGTGLGLATSYGIIKQAGGHIWVYSEPGSGTTFKIYLPRSAKVASARARAAVSSPASKGETVLLVEDHAMLRASSTRALEALGYDVISAQSGEDAIRLATAHEGSIDLLLTDVVMPKMNGQDLAERLTGARPGLRVLYVSGYTESTIRRNVERKEGTHFLSKPFASDQLARAVRDILDG